MHTVGILQVNAAVNRRLMSKVVKAIYVPPGNWGKAAIKVSGRTFRFESRRAEEEPVHLHGSGCWPN